MLEHFFNKPRKPKLAVPITYNVGWWPYQDTISIDHFTITILDSRLNLFNSKSLIAYSMKGFLKHSSENQPFVRSIHIAERMIHENDVKAIIELTPIIKIKSSKNYKGDFIPFEITNEHLVQSMHWGPNSIIFKCGAFTKEVTLQQGK